MQSRDWMPVLLTAIPLLRPDVGTATSLPPLEFYTTTPCRIVDTRPGHMPLLPGALRTFAVAGVCGIPPNARAVSLNVTAVGPTAGGQITLFPADQAVPSTSTVNFGTGQTRANNAVLGLSADGRLAAVFGGSGQVDLTLDVNGYFAEASFTRISDMTSPRVFPCAARLTDGKVLIAGGHGTGTSNPLSSAELYDPATRTFASTGSMNIARGRPQCVALSDGRVLVAGGVIAPFTYTSTAEVYNPATGTFTGAGNMTTPRGEGWYALAVPGGALLFGGTFEGTFGTATAAVDRFDSGSNSFARVGTLLGARRDYTAQMLGDNTALLVGGVLRYDLPVSPTAELYDISTNQPISIGQPNNSPRVRGWGSAVLPGGDVLVMSGGGFPAEIYRRASRSFEAIAGAPALYASDFGSAVSLSNGRVFLLGYGRASGTGGRIAEIFDPAGGTFTALGPMAFPSECQGYVATALVDGTVLVTGGGTPGNCGQGTAVAEIFGPFRLSFPLKRPGDSPYQTTISAVMDHTSSENVVEAYNGESGSVNPYTYAPGVVGYRKPDLTDFNLPFLAYEDGVPASGRKWLFYDGHTGYDYPAPLGLEVYATAGGVATVTGDQYNTFIIDHGNGYTTFYLHMSEILVSNGQTVARGELVGKVGKEGAGAYHLHVTIKHNDVPVDPYGRSGVNYTLWEE
jgi:peptidase M23-like protein/Kelch motif protein